MRRESTMRNEALKRYARDALPPVLLTMAVALAAMHFRDALPPFGRSASLVALMLCYAWLGWNDFRHIRRCDELRRRLELEAMMLAFIVATGAILCLFFADALRLLAVPFAAAPFVMVGCYVACQLWVRLRYRYWVLL